MHKRKLVYLMLCTYLLVFFPACKKYYADDDDSGSEQNNDGPGYESADDYAWDSSEVITILLNGTTIEENSDNVTVENNKATILSSGTYSLSGTLSNGQIIVNATDDGTVRLILNGVNITCSNSAPIFIGKAGKAVLYLAAGTNNYVTDGKMYLTDDSDEPNAAIFSKSYLSVFGEGSLAIEANYKDGLSGKDGLVIKSGTLDITAADDGVRGKDYLLVQGGNLTITAGGDGLKSDNEEDQTLGYITIDSTSAHINATGDGMNAQTNLTIHDGTFTIITKGGSTTLPGGGGQGQSGGYSGTLSAKALKANINLTLEKGTYNITTADDAIHSNKTVTISGGTFAISSGDDGIHAETSVTINEGTVNITKSYEGIESHTITINDGNISLVATDDAINATNGSAVEANDGSYLYINGGTLCTSTTSGDGLDSNGSIVMTAGTVIVHGPQSQPELGFDFNGTFNISGGFLVGTGPNSGNMIEAPSASSGQYCVKATIQSTLTASTLFHIQDAGGKEIVTFKPLRNQYYVVFSSEALVNNSEYSIYTGGSSTGTNTNGIYTGGTYSGGTLRKSFTITSKITNVSF
jgi:hypothetical protein